MKTIDIKIVRIDKDLPLPTYAHESDANFDIYAAEDVVVKNLDTVQIRTGIRIQLPKGYKLEIYTRSGISSGKEVETRDPTTGTMVVQRWCVAVSNAPGQIDSGYRNELKVLLFNHSGIDIFVIKGMRLAQAAPIPVIKARFVEVDELDDSDRGMSGLGDSGMSDRDKTGNFMSKYGAEWQKLGGH